MTPDLDSVIRKALEKDRNLRYQHAADIRTDLQRLKRDTVSGRYSGVSSSAVKSAVGKEERAGRKKRWVLAISVAILLAPALVTAVLYYRAKVEHRLTDKDTIVIADFANSTGDAVFDDTLKTALTVALNQSPFLNVISENKVAATLKLMTRPADTKLTPEVTRELCERAGSKAYISGAIASLGTEYVLALKAVNCQTGDRLAEEQVTADRKEKVLNALGEAATKLRSQLGESLATVQKFDVPLEQATTSSLEALQAYSLGRKAQYEQGAEAAVPYELRAIKLDPNFAMGYQSVGTSYDSLGQPGRASEYVSKAFDLRDHASEREKLIITAHYYENVTGELDKAARTLRELIESYPRDADALLRLGIVYTLEGQYEQAAEVTRQAQQLAPERLGTYANLANYMLALQRFDDAQKMIGEARTRKLDDAQLRNAMYALAFLAGNSAGMAEQQQWFAGKPEVETYGLSLASDTEAYAGRMTKARELTQRAIDAALKSGDKETAAIWWENAALREAAFGNLAEARKAAAAGVKLDAGSQAVQVEAALAYAMSGDAPRAQPLVQQLNTTYPLNTQMQSLWLPATRAQVAISGKEAAAAISDLQSAMPPVEYGQIGFVANITCLYPTYIRGQAYLAAGQGKQAAAEFQKVIDHSGMVWSCWTGALARLGVARAEALQAKNSQGAEADAARVKADAAYKDFLLRWKDADPELPIFKDAQAEYPKVKGSG